MIGIRCQSRIFGSMPILGFRFYVDCLKGVGMLDLYDLCYSSTELVHFQMGTCVFSPSLVNQKCSIDAMK